MLHLVTALLHMATATIPWVHLYEQQIPGLGQGDCHDEISSSLEPKRVAIVGAGVAGAAAAYHLDKIIHLAKIHHPANLKLDITIFEKSDRIGGRVDSAYVSTALPWNVESGALTLSADDECLLAAADDLGLKTQVDSLNYMKKHVGVWNGHHILSVGDHPTRPASGLTSWWKSARAYWKYGPSPFRTASMVDTVSGHLRSFASFSPFNNIATEMRGWKREIPVETSALDFMRRKEISEEYMHNVIEPVARSRFGQNLANISGLQGAHAMQTGLPMSILGGNRRLVDRMIKISGARLVLNTTITAIDVTDTGHCTVATKHHPHAEVNASRRFNPIEEVSDFDLVIVAAPLHLANIEIGMLSYQLRGQWSNYTDIHVTHFRSPHRLSPAFSGMPRGFKMPEDILTTRRSAPDDHDAAEIFSITTVRKIYSGERSKLQIPVMGIQEDNYPGTTYIYRVLSSQPMDDATLAKLIDAPHESSQPTYKSMSWVHRQPWPRSIPVFVNHSAFGDVNWGHSLFYLGGGDAYLSSMEMGCRIARNMANMMWYYHWSPDSFNPWYSH